MAHARGSQHHVKPDPRANELAPDAVLISVLGRKIRELTPPADISHVMQRMEGLLDESVAAEGYVITAPAIQDLASAGLVNLSDGNCKRQFLKVTRSIE